MRKYLVALAMFAATACTPPAETPPPADTSTTAPAPAPQTAAEATAQDTCAGAQYHSFIGTAVAAITVPTGVRVILPDTVVTQDFRADRVNIIADANGVVTSVECY